MLRDRLTGTHLLLAAWVVCGWADGHLLGQYSHLTLSAMTLGVLLLFVPALAPQRFPLTVPTPRALTLAVAATLLVYLPGTVLPSDATDLRQATLMMYLSFVFALTLLPRGGSVQRLGTSLALAFATVCGTALITRNTPPTIDVWYLTQNAADSILNGTSMYLGHYPDSHGVKDNFPYLPGVGLLLAPVRLVGLDVRFGLLLCCLVTAALVWCHAPRTAAPWLAIMVVAVPTWPTLISYAWTEPLLLLPLLAVFLFVRTGRLTWATVAFGLALASKQHVLLLIPVMAAWPSFGWRRVGAATIGAGLGALPWFLVTPSTFLDGALYLNLNLKPRRDSLSLFSFALEEGWRPPFFLVGLVTLVAIGASVLLLRRRGSGPLVALHCSWVLAVFHLVNKQTFYNEWWLVIALLVVALSLTEPEREPVRDPVPAPA